MSEALMHVIRYAFDVLRLPHVIIDPDVGNTASSKLAARMGAKMEGVKNYQEIWRLDRKIWYELESKREGGTNPEPVYDLKQKCCRWYDLFLTHNNGLMRTHF